MDELLDGLQQIYGVARATEHPEDGASDNYLIGWYRQGQARLLEKLERIIDQYSELKVGE